MRIGVASLLAAAHFPDYVIQNMGRWKSLAFLHYLHWAPSMMSKTLEALTDCSIFTLRDLQKMHAGAQASFIYSGDAISFPFRFQIGMKDAV